MNRFTYNIMHNNLPPSPNPNHHGGLGTKANVPIYLANYNPLTPPKKIFILILLITNTNTKHVKQ